MLGTILRLLRPSYALTALMLFGGWQGYSFVKSVPEKLSLPFGASMIEPVEKEQGTENVQSDQTEQVSPQQVSSNPTVATIQRIHPGMRILSWLVVYALLCLSTVPVIKKMLLQESNLVNAIVIIVYSGTGLLLAVGLTAFQFTWVTAIMIIAALVFSVCIIIRLAGELEKMRVQDSFI